MFTIAILAIFTSAHSNSVDDNKVRVASQFKILKLICVDRGHYEKYCPDSEFPSHNKGFVPSRNDIKVKNQHFVPKTRRETNDKIGLRFDYVVNCVKYNLFSQCTAGEVTMHVHPSQKWDNKFAWAYQVLNIVLGILVALIFGPIVLILLCLIPSAAPQFKRESFFSDD